MSSESGVALAASGVGVRAGFAVLSAAIFAYLAIDLYILLPLRAFGSLEEFYGPLSDERVANAQGLLGGWAIATAFAVVVLTVRLGAKTTWPLNSPFSIWRIVRSFAVVLGVICVGSALPVYVVGASPVVRDSVEVTVRHWELGVIMITIGVWATTIALGTFAVGGVVRLIRTWNSRTPRAPDDGGASGD